MNGRAVRGALLGLVVASAASAQKTVVNSLGWIFRYHGDTIWLEHDTTVARAIYHGDTVDRTETLDGRPRYTIRYLLRGDSADILSMRDSTGALRERSASVRALPGVAVLVERQMLENELRASNRRSMAPVGTFDRLEPPAQPEPARTYTIGRTVTMVQHRDTVRYISGCAAVGHADTTTFILFGRDSVRRTTPNPRMFGQAMALSLVGHMKSAILQEDLTAIAGDVSRELPPIRDPCKTGT
ncbi:MAG: hypothetical protein ACREPM_07785 [Gemmatimonadaceae bacterium]